MNLFNKQGKQTIVLNTSKQINSGGEGSIYEHPSNKHLVIKIYHPGITPNVTEESVDELSTLPDNFVFPHEIFYDSKGSVVGYKMAYVSMKDRVLLNTIYNKANALKGGFTSDIKKLMFNNIMFSVMAAHNKGIVVGDLNPYNIFVNKNGDCIFIDVDSFQTKNRKHSGVILPDVRDWMNNDITEESDYYALAVMAFQMFTYVHPFKGVHKTIKNLEERVVKHLSILSGDKDIIIPSFYEPFVSAHTVEMFQRIFHKDERFLVDLSISGVAISNVHLKAVSIVKVAGITVLKISDGVMEFYAIQDRFYVKTTPDIFVIYSCDTNGVTKILNKHFDVQQVLLGDKKGLLFSKDRIYTEDLREITNFELPYSNKIFQKNGHAIVFDEEKDSYSLLHLDRINGAIAFDIGNIYVKSIEIGDEIIQSINNQKWILDISEGYLKTIRTTLNIKNAYIDGDIGCIEHLENGNIVYTLVKIEGLKIIPTTKGLLDSFRYLTQKGDYLYVPEEGYISVRSKIDFREVLHLTCPQVTSQSRLKSVKAGILCQTHNILYLINKNN